MKKGWTTTKLIAIGSLTALYFLFQAIVVKGIFLSTGSIFGASSSIVITPFFTVFVPLITQQFGSATLFRVLCVLVALPIPSIIPKPVNLFMEPLRGLLVDILFLRLGRKRRIFSFLGGAVDNFVLSLELIIFYFSIGLPGTQNIPKFLVSPLGLIICTVAVLIIGGLAGYAGFLMYEKLSKTAVVKRIQAA